MCARIGFAHTLSHWDGPLDVYTLLVLCSLHFDIIPVSRSYVYTVQMLQIMTDVQMWQSSDDTYGPVSRVEQTHA